MVHVPAIQLKKAMFKRGLFDFVTCVEKDGVVLRHEKQELALRCLTSGKYREVAYGGAAGGAKSWTGCVWLAFVCQLFPGTRWVYFGECTAKWNSFAHCILFLRCL